MFDHRLWVAQSGGHLRGILSGSRTSDLNKTLAGRTLLVYACQVAKNTGTGSRKGAVKERVQALNPVTKRYVKIDTSTGRIVDHKKTAGPYKGVREVTTKKK